MKKNYTIRKIIKHGESIGVTIPPGNIFKLGDYVKVFVKDDLVVVEKVEE